MNKNNGIKSRVARSLIPAARLYLRYAPWRFLKQEVWASSYWREKTFRVRTDHSLVMVGTTAEMIQRYIYFFGVWEPNLTAFVTGRLKSHPDRIFVDVGANIGYFSLLASIFLPRGKVIAIEAFPEIHRKLLRHLQINRSTNIDAIHCAASDVVGEIDIFHGGVADEGATTTVQGKFSTPGVKVCARPLTDILGTDDVKRVKLMKIDVEGAEAKVIQGLKGLLPALPSDAEIVVEITPRAHDDANSILDTMRAFGFNAYHLENRYDPQSYFFRATVVRPTRLRRLPEDQADIVFSRVDAEIL